MGQARFHQKWLSYHEISDYEVALDKDLVFEGSRGDCVIAPRGFITDFASVPGFLHGFIGPRGAYTRAAIIHDWLCVQLKTKYWKINGRDTDGLFRLMLKILGVSFWMRWFMWSGVRWGALFNPHRRASWFRGRDPWLVLLVSLVALPIVLPIAAAALASWLLMAVLALITRVVRVR